MFSRLVTGFGNREISVKVHFKLVIAVAVKIFLQVH